MCRLPSPNPFRALSTRRCFQLIACGVILLASWQSAFGQGTIDKRFHLAVQPQFGVSRGHAPLSLSVALRWSSAELMEGHLQLEWFVGTVRLGRYVSTELALSDSSILLDLMLPPVMLSHDEVVFSVQGKFITNDGKVYDLDVHDVALQPDWRRILLVGTCTTPGAPSAIVSAGSGNRRARRFRLEPFFESRFTRRELLVEDTEVDPTDVPTDPLRMTAFDTFVIPADSLAKLKPRQLEALLAWVRAGGSLCVFVDAAVPVAHVAWLNQLAGRDPTDAAFLQAADGRVVAASDSVAGLSRHHLDYGRVVIAMGEVSSDDEWERSVLFLWKVRRDRCRAAGRGELWKLEPPRVVNDYLLATALQPQRHYQQTFLTNLLLPESVRGLPLGTVSLVLAVFLLIIAPGDYLVLGWLKRHRWTWILFPTVSLLFTGYMMWLARQHLGQASYERAITVIDLGQNGQPVRTSRFEMLYAASSRIVTSEQQQQSMVPLDSDSPSYEQPWTYSGRVPQDYTVQRDVQQWSPRMARITAFGGDGATDAMSASGTLRLRLSRDSTEFERRRAEIPTSIISLAENITRRPATGMFSVVSQISPTCGGNWEDLAVLDGSNQDHTVIVDISSPAEGEYVITRQLHRESH